MLHSLIVSYLCFKALIYIFHLAKLVQNIWNLLFKILFVLHGYQRKFLFFDFRPLCSILNCFIRRSLPKKVYWYRQNMICILLSKLCFIEYNTHFCFFFFNVKMLRYLNYLKYLKKNHWFHLCWTYTISAKLR